MTTYISKLDYRILSIVKTSKYPISTNKVAEQVGISWQKADNHLSLLWKKGLISRLKTSRQRYKWL